MTFRIQQLDLRPRAEASAAQRVSVGRVWVNCARPKSAGSRTRCTSCAVGMIGGKPPKW